MKIFILHLSDLHIETVDDFILKRADHIARAAKDLEHDVGAVLGIVSGDIAFSGQEDQYLAAFGFLEELSELLVGYYNLSAMPVWAIVPGNHDCNFDLDSQARRMLVEHVRANPDRAGEPSVAEELLTVQDPYFESLPLLDNVVTMDKRGLADKTVVQFDDYHVAVASLNTSFASQKVQEQGALVFPVEAVPTPGAPRVDLSVTVFHHPYSWLAAGNKRRFQERIEAVSDIIFTGHEHESRGTESRVLGEETSLYLEGGVLQEHYHEEKSSFNGLLVDLEGKRQKFYQFSWEGTLYKLIGRPEREWEELQVQGLRSAGTFRLKAATEKWLDDPGLSLTHRQKENLRLNDIFVYPELERNDLTRNSSLLIRSENVFETIREQNLVSITGEENSGKTTLAKKLFRDFRDAGYVPLLMDGANLRGRSQESIRRSLYRTYESQYATPDVERFRQLSASRRVVIVDDFQDSFQGRPPGETVFPVLMSFSERLIVLAAELEYDLNRLMLGMDEAGEFSDLARYTIEEFGHYLRQRLVDKWFSIGKEAGGVDAEFARQLSQAKSKVDTVLGTNFLPSYPVFILSILQAVETATPVDVDVGSYGAFYEVFVRRSLAEISTIEGFDIKVTYLSHIAYAMFMDGTRSLDEERLREIHQAYQDKYDMNLNYRNLLNELIGQDILMEVGEAHRFKYQYAYYYFVANYLRLNLHAEQTREIVAELCESLHVEERANILLFLTHLSRDPLMLDSLVKAAQDVFPDVEAVSLETTPVFLEGLSKAVREIVYVERDPIEERDARLRARDSAVRSQKDQGEVVSEDRSDDSAVLDEINRLNSALKTLQILGQVLKNFPGSIEADRKTELLESCYGVGRRAIGVIYRFIDNSREELLEEIVSLVERQHPSFGREKVQKRAQETLFGLTEFLTYGFVKSISRAVGSRRLERSYKRLLEQNEVPVVELIDCSLKLDHFPSFPEGEIVSLGEKFDGVNLLAETILRDLVVQHFRIFPRDQRLRQRICSKLGIRYRKSIEAPDPSRAKVASGD